MENHNAKNNTSQKPLPRARTSETRCLGTGITNYEYMEKLSSNDLYETRDIVILQALQEMRQKGIPSGDLELRQYLIDKGLMEKINGGFVYIGSLVDDASETNFSYHFNELKRIARLRLSWKWSVKLSQAIQNGADMEVIEKIKEEIVTIENTDSMETNGLIRLTDYTPAPMRWILKDAIPDKFSTTIYGDGGLGKSFLGLYLSTLVSIGGQSFLGLRFNDERRNVLYLDYELDVDEFSRRALRVSKGLGLPSIPEGLSYLSPGENLYKLLPKLKGIIKSRKIGFLVIDSLGASCIDPERVIDIVEVFSEIKNLGIATLILDHQSKLQSQDNYNIKTPYGSIYKFNLSRSVFQVSSIGRDNNKLSIMLRHKKSNFSKLLDDLVFDICFEGDRVEFLQSKMLSPEDRDMMLIHQTIVKLELKGEKINQKTIIADLDGVLGRNLIINLLEKGERTWWTKAPGNKREFIYKPKSLKSHPIYNRDFKLLDSEDEIEIPEVIR